MKWSTSSCALSDVLSVSPVEASKRMTESLCVLEMTLISSRGERGGIPPHQIQKLPQPEINALIRVWCLSEMNA